MEERWVIPDISPDLLAVSAHVNSLFANSVKKKVERGKKKKKEKRNAARQRFQIFHARFFLPPLAVLCTHVRGSTGSAWYFMPRYEYRFSMLDLLCSAASDTFVRDNFCTNTWQTRGRNLLAH